MLAPQAKRASVSRVAEVERRDRRPLASARARRGGPPGAARIGPVNTSTSGCSRAAAEQRREPPGATRDVVVDERHELAARALTPVLRATFKPSGRGVRLIARAEALGQRARRARGAGVVDHEHLRAGLRGLRGDRGERHLEIGQARARRDHDRGGTVDSLGLRQCPFGARRQ